MPKCSGPTWTTRCRSLSAVLCRMFAMVSSRFTGVCCTPCTTADTVPIAASRSARAWSATSWATSTRTVTRPSTTRSCVWFSRGTCATRSFRVRATSVRPVMTARLLRVTRNARWRLCPWKWSGTSKRRPSTSRTTTTAATRSPSTCRRASRTCWSTVRPVLPLAWPPTFRRTTCAKSQPVRSGC